MFAKKFIKESLAKTVGTVVFLNNQAVQNTNKTLSDSSSYCFEITWKHIARFD